MGNYVGGAYLLRQDHTTVPCSYRKLIYSIGFRLDGIGLTHPPVPLPSVTVTVKVGLVPPLNPKVSAWGP